MPSVGWAQITLIPDSEFEEELIDLGIDTDGIINGQVLTADIADETELIIVGLPITDLTGLEDFASLDYLSLDELAITELNLSQNLQLRVLNLGFVSLSSLDITNNVNLETAFISVKCETCPFISAISSVDFSQNVLLDFLVVRSNFITKIDVSNNPNITAFEIKDMNDLIQVSLKSGNNADLDFLRIMRNPNLLCVQVDDPQGVIAGVNPPYDNWIIENSPLISEDCFLGLDEVISVGVSIFPNPAQDMVTISPPQENRILSIVIYDVLGNFIMEKEKDFNYLDVSSWQSGLYFFKIQTQRGASVEKVLIN